MTTVIIAIDQMGSSATPVAYPIGCPCIAGIDVIPAAVCFATPRRTLSQALQQSDSTTTCQLSQVINSAHLEHSVFESRHISLRPEPSIRENPVLTELRPAFCILIRLQPVHMRERRVHWPQRKLSMCIPRDEMHILPKKDSKQEKEKQE